MHLAQRLAMICMITFQIGMLANGIEIFDISTQSYCSSIQLPFERDEMSTIYFQNVSFLKQELPNGRDMVEKLEKEGVKYLISLLADIMSFVWRQLKIFILLAAMLLVYLILAHRGGQLATQLKQQNSKIQKIVALLLIICSFFIVFESVQAMRTVSNQQTHFSEISCLLKTGPKMRLNEGTQQKYLTMDGILQSLLPHEVYQTENFNEISVLLRNRVDLYENLKLAKYIRNSSITSTISQQYLQQIDSLIISIEQMITAKAIYDGYQTRMRFRSNYSGYTDEIRAFKTLQQKIEINSLQNIAYKCQVALICICILTGAALSYYSIGMRFNKTFIISDLKIYNRIISFSIYIFIILLIFFSILSIILAGIFLFNNGIIRLAESNELSSHLAPLYQFGEFIQRILPNSREISNIKYKELITTAQQYQQMYKNIAEKQNDYYYLLFKQSLGYLNETEKNQVQSKLKLACISESKMVAETRIARDAFGQMIASLDKESTLNRIQFADYGRYLIEIFKKLEKAIIVNFYSLRKHIGRLCSAFLIIFFLGHIANQTQNQGENHEPESNELSSQIEPSNHKHQHHSQQESDQFTSN